MMRFWVLAVLFILAPVVPACGQAPTDAAWSSQRVMVPMRDGVRLQTFIVTPRRTSTPLPMLLVRTPYGAAGGVRGFPGAYRYLANDGYVFVFQDIRGRNGSEGQYLMNRPLRSDSTSVCSRFLSASSEEKRSRSSTKPRLARLAATASSSLRSSFGSSMVPDHSG